MSFLIIGVPLGSEFPTDGSFALTADGDQGSITIPASGPPVLGGELVTQQRLSVMHHPGHLTIMLRTTDSAAVTLTGPDGDVAQTRALLTEAPVEYGFTDVLNTGAVRPAMTGFMAGLLAARLVGGV